MGRDLHCDFGEFATAWDAAPSVRALASCFGLTVAQAYRVAWRLRQLGVPLKKFRGGRPGRDYAAAVEYYRERGRRLDGAEDSVQPVIGSESYCTEELLCSRCKRVGSASGCRECQALRYG